MNQTANCHIREYTITIQHTIEPVGRTLGLFYLYRRSLDPACSDSSANHPKTSRNRTLPPLCAVSWGVGWRGYTSENPGNMSSNLMQLARIYRRSKAELMTKQAKTSKSWSMQCSCGRIMLDNYGKLTTSGRAGTKLQSIQHIRHIISPSKHKNDGCPWRSHTILANLESDKHWQTCSETHQPLSSPFRQASECGRQCHVDAAAPLLGSSNKPDKCHVVTVPSCWTMSIYSRAKEKACWSILMYRSLMSSSNTWSACQTYSDPPNKTRSIPMQPRGKVKMIHRMCKKKANGTKHR